MSKNAIKILKIHILICSWRYEKADSLAFFFFNLESIKKLCCNRAQDEHLKVGHFSAYCRKKPTFIYSESVTVFVLLDHIEGRLFIPFSIFALLYRMLLPFELSQKRKINFWPIFLSWLAFRKSPTLNVISVYFRVVSHDMFFQVVFPCSNREKVIFNPIYLIYVNI